jgi:ABC-type branched-subunit amino acid transport system substrate-binding protein
MLFIISLLICSNLSLAFLVSETASTYGDRHAIIQMGFASTSVTLSDKTSYPLFARSCPSDAGQGEVIVELLYHYGLKNISIVSVSDDTYSSSLASIIINR